MLPACVWPPCWDVLRHVGCSWFKFENGQNFHVTFVYVAWCCSRLAGFVQQCCARACALVRFSTRNMSQHNATGWPHASNILRSTLLRSVAFNCCDRLPGACKWWANNVGMCCVETLLSFGRGFRILIYRPWAIRVPWKCGKLLMDSVNRSHYSRAEIFTQLFDLKNSALMT